MSKKQEEILDVIFSSGGLFARLLDDFEEREGQRAMAGQILQAYHKEGIALIEAGTGIGKSLAYLVPAIFWALKHKEKTVISTHTIALQEQLIQKDVPFLLKALDVDIKAVLVKGMSNYLCVRKLEELSERESLFIEEKDRELVKLEKWADKTTEGSRSELSFAVSPSLWGKVNADTDTCNHVSCPHYKRCFFFKARREIADAQILIVNHHLLFADLLNQEEKALLPNYRRVIIDEAHHLEEIALDSLSKRIDRLGLILLINRLSSENYAAEKKHIVSKIEAAFQALEGFCKKHLKVEDEKFRLKAEVFIHPVWCKEVKPLFEELADELQKLAHILLSEEKEDASLNLQSIGQKITENGETISHFFEESGKRVRVRWIEMNGNIALADADMDISNFLRSNFFKKMATATLCSATLTSGREFQFIRERLGIAGQNVTENIYDSPFDYQNRSLLAVPTDIPLPNEAGFIDAAVESIVASIQASEGNAFVLFTSYEMLNACYAKVFDAVDFALLKQGDASRQTLLEKFKAMDGSVLFGTDSFWEGVDVAGEALRCVILTKLPFRVPNDPMVQAHSEVLIEQGKDPFFDFAVPQAVMKFKQGFGRLMRKKNDRGCIVCLDKRLITKGYGKIFLKSLPPCSLVSGARDKVFKEMKGFYDRTKVYGA